MRGFIYACAAGALFVLSAAAQPSITGLQNNYSYIRPGLPNYGIASGSIFVMYGKNMGPAAVTSLQSAPLSKTYGGVTINVTASDGKTYQAIPYYVSATQSAAILPSATPAGNGTITVTYNGQTSAPAPIMVVKSAFGILTLNGAGSGTAAAFDAKYNYLGFSNSANPNDVITFWGTGLGAAPGDETQLGANVGDLANIPIQVWIGGQPAQVQYHGRSQFPGLDQVNVYVPSGVTGCYVSVVVQSGSIVSNQASIPVAASGRKCSDTNGFASSDLSALLAKGAASIGFISVGRTVTQSTGISIPGVPATTTTSKSDIATAEFVRYTPAQLQAASGLVSQSSFGSCTITTVVGTGSYTDPTLPVFLDAGPSITMTAPSSTVNLVRNAQVPIYTSPTGPTSLSFIPDTGGTFSFNNGSGGADVKGFNTSLTLPAPLIWTNMDATTTVDRTAGVTATWSGGDPNTYVQISGSSFYFTSTSGVTPDLTSAVVVAYVCTAPVSARTFTVPPPVLLALPPSGSISVGGISIAFPGSMSVGNYTNPQKFTAPGTDVSYVSGYYSNGKSVTYK